MRFSKKSKFHLTVTPVCKDIQCHLLLIAISLALNDFILSPSLFSMKFLEFLSNR